MQISKVTFVFLLLTAIVFGATVVLAAQLISARVPVNNDPQIKLQNG